jgi:hypothetical protein
MQTFQDRSKNINHEIKYEPSFTYDNSNVILGEPNLITELQYEKTTEQGEEPSYRWTSDVTLLFNQERIAKSLSAEQVRQWLMSLKNPSSTIDYSGVSDELIMATIKSRHIQSMSELQAWTNELLEKVDNIESSVNSLEQEDYS